MTLSWTVHELHLRHTFRISRSASDVARVVILHLEHDGIVGYGEASPTRRYGETPETVTAFLASLDLSRYESPMMLEDILAVVEAAAPGNTSAKCAVDLALHDWMGKKLGVPLYALWGLTPERAPLSSFTIAIDSTEVVRKKVEEAAEFPILKVKLGGDNDEEMISTIRSMTDKTLYVDANEGWKDRETALARVRWLKDKNIGFIEQPMPAAQLDDLRWLHERSEIPLIADESVVRLDAIPSLAGAFDGINIKLMKCTGLREAMRMIAVARALKMKVMMGCMIETAVGISAGAQLAPLLDYADLDGNVLITDDPFDGVRNTAGRLTLTPRPGHGAVPR